MAVTANQLAKYSFVGELSRDKISLGASQTLYGKTMVIGRADGYAYSSKTPAATDFFMGFAKEKYDNSAGSAGAVVGEVEKPRKAWVPLSGAVQADIGELAYASDNFTATKTSTDNVLLGVIREVGTNEALIEFTYQPA